MTLTAELTAARSQTVGMGQVCLAHGFGQLTAVLGSCIGVTLHHPGACFAAMAHVVLPSASGRPGHPGKFADTAIPYMLELLRNEGVSTAGLVVRIAGGASMFGAKGPMQIGASNAEAVIAALTKARLPLAAQHVGGNQGRRVTLDAASGLLSIEIAGKPPVAI
jgi:chemotaxis protein CheD